MSNTRNRKRFTFGYGTRNMFSSYMSYSGVDRNSPDTGSSNIGLDNFLEGALTSKVLSSCGNLAPLSYIRQDNHNDTSLIFFQIDYSNSHDIYFLHNNFKILFSLSSQEVWGFFDIFYSPNLHNSYEGERCLHTPCVFNVAFQVFQPPSSA